MAGGWLLRLVGFVLMAFLWVAIVWGATGLPRRGDPLAPATVHQSVAVYYIERSYEETRTPNLVTAVLVDYRGFDTFGEALVVVVAALSCLLILSRAKGVGREGRGGEGGPAGGAQ